MFETKMLDNTYYKISKDWETADLSVIPVTVHVPQNVPERVKQLKINLIYDILKPKNADISVLERVC